MRENHFACALSEDAWSLPAEIADGSRNGLSVPDLLLAPLVHIAAGVLSHGLQPPIRKRLPKPLFPLIGFRLKLGAKEQARILEFIGRDQPFTEMILQVFREAHSSCCAKILKGWPTQLVNDSDDPAHAFCVLLAIGRTSEALNLASVFMGDCDSLNAPQLRDSVSRFSDLRKEVDRLALALAHEEKRRARAELVAKKATSEAAAATQRLNRETSRLRQEKGEWLESRNLISELTRRLEDRTLAFEALERQQTRLNSDFERLQQRYFRTRRLLREARSKLPIDECQPKVGSLVEGSSERQPPSASQLDQLFRTKGPRAVIDATPILLFVDGWNVALNALPDSALEVRRSMLEQSLVAYEARTGNRVVLIYDGTEQVASTKLVRSSIIRVFTAEGETADDCIVSELELGVGNFAPVVVTSDKSLARRCRKRGAFVLSTQEFGGAMGMGSQMRR